MADCADAINKGVACYTDIGKKSKGIELSRPKYNRSCAWTGATGRDTCKKYNDDFEWLRRSDCKDNSRVPVCYRVRHTADPTKCCANISDGIKSCDPKYTSSNIACTPFLQKYCTGTKVFTNQSCVSFGKTPNGINNVINYCNTLDGLNNPSCRSWCIKNGGCDQGALLWCNKSGNKNKSFCSCLIDEHRPECFNNTCTMYGYKTNAQRNPSDCGSLQICEQKIMNLGGNINMDRTEIIQNCIKNNSIETDDSKKFRNKPIVRNNNNTSPNYDKNGTNVFDDINYIYVFIFIITVIIFGASINMVLQILSVSSNKNKNP